MNWEGYYHEPRDLPGTRPVYIARSDPGIIYASTNITGRGLWFLYSQNLTIYNIMKTQCRPVLVHRN